MQSPVFQAIKQAHPGWHITAWVAPRGTKTLAHNNAYIDEVIEEPIKRSLEQHLSLTRRLRQSHFDIGIVLSPGQLIKSSLYLFASSIPVRVGHYYPLGHNPHSHLFLTHAIPEQDNLHDIEQNLSLLNLLGIPPASTPVQYSLVIPITAQKQAEVMLAQLQLPLSKKIIGFHVGSAPQFHWKRWPLEYFAAIGRQLIERNAHILLLGSLDEIGPMKKMRRLLGSDTTIITADLLTTAAIMQHCRVLVSNDSGLMHVGAATGVKTLGLFGPTDEKKTGPRGPKSYVVRAPGTSPVYHTEKNFSLGIRPHESLVALKPAQVIRTITDLLS
ncbi:MAG: glycosyltransferase family 9 protein [Candidatus Andersenbacteria bacterium]